MFDMNLSKLEALIKGEDVIDVILDTDAYNEVDDQYCLAYLMKSPERVNLLSVNAAPFLNDRSTSAADGMEKSYNEIFKVMKLVDDKASIPVYRGSTKFMDTREEVVPSDAADNIINTVKNSEKPVVIIAIGAITNVASALVQWPELAQHAGLIWLGGHALNWPHTREFNLKQDIPAAQVVFNSGIPFVQVPCGGVTTEMITTVPELHYYLDGKNPLCDYLVKNVADVCVKFAGSRIIWDPAAAAVLLARTGCAIVKTNTPIVTDDGYYAFDMARRPYLYVRKLTRDVIFGDMFKKLSK